MLTQQTISCLIMALVAVILLSGAPSSMAADAYNTGEGHGYASCASTAIMPSGTIFRVVRMQPNINLALFCNEIERMRHALLCPWAFMPIMHYRPVRKI